MAASTKECIVTKSHRLILPLTLVAVVIVTCRVAADWPLFRGNALQSGVTQTNLPAQLEIRWKTHIKDGIDATAAIVKDTVYVGAFDGTLRAFDLATGKEHWKYQAGAFKAPPSVL